MKSPSIDKLYTILDKHVRLTESYTEIKGLANIIKLCRLKPYDYLFGNRSPNLILYKLWVDEFGNSIFIDKKNISITYNNLNLNKTNCTDIYYGLSLEKIVKISKAVIIFFGKEEEDEFIFLTFLGIDNYFRSYLFEEESFEQVSTLLIGFKNLKIIEHNLDINYFKELKIKENSPLPCQGQQAWLTCLPASSEFISLISKHNEYIGSLLKKE